MNIRVSAIFVALLACLAGTAAAQVANTGTIQVTVEDTDGGRLPGVTVTATATDTITRRTAVSDAQGIASLEALAPSTQYLVTVELTGFQTRHAAGGAGPLRSDHDDRVHARRGRSDRGHRGVRPRRPSST